MYWPGKTRMLAISLIQIAYMYQSDTTMLHVPVWYR